MTDISDSDDGVPSDYIDEGYQRTRNGKRRKIRRDLHFRRKETDTLPPLSLSPLLDCVNDNDVALDSSFDAVMETLLPEYLRDRAAILAGRTEKDVVGQNIRPMTRYEVSRMMNDLESGKLVGPSHAFGAMALRKLKLQRERQRAGVSEASLNQSHHVPVSVLSPTQPPQAPNPQVINALYAIKTTPYESSFLSRLASVQQNEVITVTSVNLETVSPWMTLMNDIRDHYMIAHPERELPCEVPAPIIYTHLRPCHLTQVHNLLHRVFWTGIDVSDSLQVDPERCTIIAAYKKLVVGVAFLSSPEETYITYLAVRAGWENAGIATTMLHRLILLNPRKDITLHVSTNNPAMLLYNRFGFKAEEFVAGFYEDYVDPDSRLSKNAFRLRLRR